MFHDTVTALQALYLAALDPSGWANFLDATRKALHAPVSGFSVFDAQAQTNRIWLTSGLDEPSLEDYDTHYAACNPRTTVLKQLPDGEWFRCHEHFDESFVGRSEFYQDFLAARDLRYAIAGVMVRTDRHTVHFGAWRNKSAGAFDDRDMEVVKTLTPHLQGVLSFALKAEGRAMVAAGPEEERSAVIVLAQGRHVVSMNAAADQLLRQSPDSALTVSHGVLVFAAPDMNVAIDRHLDASRRLFRPRPAESIGFEHDVAALAGPLPGKLGRHLRMAPIHPDQFVWIPGRHVPLARLTIHPAALSHSNAPARPAFILTPAEAAIAHLICKGMTLEAIANSRGVKRSTVKSQVEALFRKSGTRNQKELIVQLVRAGYSGQGSRATLA